MIPIALLGSAVYMGLHLLQASLAQEKERKQSLDRLRLLEQELDQFKSQATRDKITHAVR